MNETAGGQIVICKDCGTQCVWSQGKSGKWFLQDITGPYTYDNGKRYLRGPHFKTCIKGKYYQQRMAACQAEIARKGEAAKKLLEAQYGKIAPTESER